MLFLTTKNRIVGWLNEIKESQEDKEMVKNPMDSKSIKDREEEMGLSEGQKAALIASGLSKEEVNDIHKRRVAEAIEREREFLEKMERKMGKGLSELAEKFANYLEKGEDVKEDMQVGSPIYTNDEAQRLIIAECEKNPDYAKALEEFNEVVLDLDATKEEIRKAANRLADIVLPTAKPFGERRWKGYIEEYRKYVENGEVGNPPDPFSEYYSLPIFDCGNYII